MPHTSICHTHETYRARHTAVSLWRTCLGCVTLYLCDMCVTWVHCRTPETYRATYRAVRVLHKSQVCAIRAYTTRMRHTEQDAEHLLCSIRVSGVWHCVCATCVWYMCIFCTHATHRARYRDACLWHTSRVRDAVYVRHVCDVWAYASHMSGTCVRLCMFVAYVSGVWHCIWATWVWHMCIATHMRHAEQHTELYVCGIRLGRVTLYMCDMCVTCVTYVHCHTHETYRARNRAVCVWHKSRGCDTAFEWHMSDQVAMVQMSFMCVWDMTHSCVWQCAWDMTHSLSDMACRWVSHHSCVCETWRIHVWDMAHPYVWHDLIICVPHVGPVMGWLRLVGSLKL